MWLALEVVPSTGSTNADLLARATDPGSPEGQVLVAEEQTAGRGRLGRSWSSVPGASLTFSVLLRPDAVPAARRGWLTLLAGVAVASAVRSVGGVDAVLKWPNDVLVGDRKLAGILAEQSPDGSAVVIGTGLNVAAAPGELPVSAAGLAPHLAARRGRDGLPHGPATRHPHPAGTLVYRLPRRPGPGPVRAARRLPGAVRDAGANGPRRVARRPRHDRCRQGHRRRGTAARRRRLRWRGHARLGRRCGPRPRAG